MLKRLLGTPLSCGFAAFALALAPAQDPGVTDDRAGVERAVLDYVEALYEVKPELIDRSLHPDLVFEGEWKIVHVLWQTPPSRD